MRLLSALFLFCSLSYAEVVYPGYGVIAHVVHGGGIQTEFTITNLDDEANCYFLWFFDDKGSQIPLETDAGIIRSFSDSLGPHASRTIRTTGAANIQGYGRIRTSGNVAASTTFRFSVAPWTGSAVTVPADFGINTHFSLPFDHTGSTVTGLAIVSSSVDKVNGVTLMFRQEDGNLIVSDTFNLTGHRAIATTTSYPATAGRRGTIEISSTDYLSVLALRYGPSAISSVTQLVSSKWAASDGRLIGCWDY